MKKEEGGEGEFNKKRGGKEGREVPREGRRCSGRISGFAIAIIFSKTSSSIPFTNVCNIENTFYFLFVNQLIAFQKNILNNKFFLIIEEEKYKH